MAGQELATPGREARAAGAGAGAPAEQPGPTVLLVLVLTTTPGVATGDLALRAAATASWTAVGLRVLLL